MYEGAYWSDNVTVDLTSVADVELAHANVYVADGTLHVEAIDGELIEVYSLEAQRIVVAQGSVAVELPQGVYIVKVGDKVRKVVVK